MGDDEDVEVELVEEEGLPAWSLKSMTPSTPATDEDEGARYPVGDDDDEKEGGGAEKDAPCLVVR